MFLPNNFKMNEMAIKKIYIQWKMLSRIEESVFGLNSVEWFRLNRVNETRDYFIEEIQEWK